MVRVVLSVFLIALGFCATAFSQQPVLTSAPETEKGVELYRAGSYDKAIETLQAALTLDKKDKLAWVYLGASYLKLGREEDAVKAFRTSRFTYLDASSKLETDLKVTRKPRPRFTERARQNNTAGEVKLAVEFKADGTIGFVFPFQSLPNGLTENSIQAARETEFKPAVKDGKAVDVVSVMVYSFMIY